MNTSSVMNYFAMVIALLAVQSCNMRYVGPGGSRTMGSDSTLASDYMIDSKGRRCFKRNDGVLVPIEDDKKVDYDKHKERTVVKIGKLTVYDSKYNQSKETE